MATATVNGKFTRTTTDGFGRAVKVEKGHGTTVVSVVDSEYAACACSPMGKLKRVSRPYSPGGTVYWTTYTWDALGRTTQITGPAGQSTTYEYVGNTVKVTDAAGKWRTYTMDAAGNIAKVTEPNPAGGTWDTLYSYDSLGRLSSAATTSTAWGLSWSFDGFGNRLQQAVTKGSAPVHSAAVDGLTNRIIGQSYDANGNMLIPGLVYDVDNRLAGDGVIAYMYSTANQRLKAYDAATTTNYAWFHGFEGEMLAVYKLEKENGDANKTWPVLQTTRERVYALGRLIRMGTNDVVVDRGASVIRHGSTNLAYYPYGEEQGGASANDRAKFATYTRDASTGLDYAWNRMYKVEWGRFTSVDPLSTSATQAKPGSWNRCSYVEGDPVNSSDSTGLGPSSSECSGTNSRSGYIDPLCTEGVFWDGMVDAFGFRPTEDYLMWDARMGMMLFQSPAFQPGGSGGGSAPTTNTGAGNTPVVTTTITFPTADALTPAASQVLSAVGQTTQPLTQPSFWIGWTGAASFGGLLQGIATALAPSTLYHFTSSATASAIGAGAAYPGPGLFGWGIYGSAFNSAPAAYIMGASSTEAVVPIAGGLGVAASAWGPVVFPGSYRLITPITIFGGNIP